MALVFTNTNEAGTDTNILVYGRSDSGKTFLIPSAPRPVIISSEKGLVSIKDHDIKVATVETLEDLESAYDFLRNKKEFKTICLDSLTDISKAILTQLLKENKDPRKAYGLLNSGIEDIIRKFRNLDKNVYFVAQAEVYENAAGMSALRPAMPGKTLTNGLPYFFDVVGLLQVGADGKRTIVTKSTNTVEAKDRAGKLKNVEVPDLKVIFKKLKE